MEYPNKIYRQIVICEFIYFIKNIFYNFYNIFIVLWARVVTAWRQLARSLELQSLNDLGFSKRYVRCLQVNIQQFF